MNRPDSAEAELAQMSIFVVKKQYRVLTNNDSADLASEQRLFSFNDLVHCACFPDFLSNQKSMKQIAKCSSLLLQYEWILQKMSVAFDEAQVAASSDKLITTRNTEQFTLEIKADNSNSEQVYLLLSLKPSLFKSLEHENGLFLHCILKDEFKVVRFNHVIDGQAQILLEKSGGLYTMLSDANAKIYLC
ncbi:MAG: hypothetical protein ACI97K_000487 [Glaciecola sp.]|jgi:hypothetical protein